MFVVDSFFIAVLSVDVIYELTYTAGIKEMFVNVVTFLFKIREMEKSSASFYSCDAGLFCCICVTGMLSGQLGNARHKM
jgi:hypothetical protein